MVHPDATSVCKILLSWKLEHPHQHFLPYRPSCADSQYGANLLVLLNLAGMCQSSRVYSSSIYFAALLFTLYSSMVVRMLHMMWYLWLMSATVANAVASTSFCRHSNYGGILVWPELYGFLRSPLFSLTHCRHSICTEFASVRCSYYFAFVS